MSYIYIYIYIYMEHPFLMFLDHTQRRSTVGSTPLDEWSALRRDLYLTTHDTHNRQISMPPVGFEPTISAGERPQTYALNCAATGTGFYIHTHIHTYIYTHTHTHTHTDTHTYTKNLLRILQCSRILSYTFFSPCIYKDSRQWWPRSLSWPQSPPPPPFPLTVRAAPAL